MRELLEPMPAGFAELNSQNQARVCEVVRAGPSDSPPWLLRIGSEAVGLLGLSERSGPERLQVAMIEAPDDLRAVVFMGVPVPCMPAGGDSLEIAPRAVFGLTYPRAALLGPMPGTSFIEILSPQWVWHPNVGGPGQRLCLGLSLPAGIRVTDLLFMAYAALSMQTVQLDEQDPAGVLNPQACLWWQMNRHRVPLSRAPFLKP
jgi:hypothetical protein